MAIRTEESFLGEQARLPDDLEILEGVTVGQMKEMFRRSAVDPVGSRFVSSVTYSSAAGDVGQMALYARSDAAERAPMVLFTHGGGFHGGHHFGAIRYMAPLASRGYVAATMTYRLAGEAPWPAAIEDAKCAVRWLRRHAHDLGGDPDRIVMVGDSAGAHLSVMTALTPGLYEGDGGWSEVSSDIQGAVLFYPPVDLALTAARATEQGMPELGTYFGADLEAASPNRHVRAGCPPIFTMTGGADPLTTVEDIERFHAALAAAGVDQRLEVVPGVGHSFDAHPTHFERCLSLLIDFVKQTVG